MSKTKAAADDASGCQALQRQHARHNAVAEKPGDWLSGPSRFD
jgi:hypothetical protein